MKKTFLLLLSLPITTCFSSDIVTKKDMDELNRKIKICNTEDKRELLKQGSPTKIENLLKYIFQSEKPTSSFVSLALETCLDRIPNLTTEMFYSDISYFKSVIQSHNKSNLSYFYYIESSIFFLNEGKLEEMENNFKIAQSIEKENTTDSLTKSRRILSHIVTTSLNQSKKNEVHSRAFYRKFAQTYESIRKNTEGFSIYDVVDCINLSALYYVGENFDDCLTFSHRALNLEWPKKDNEFYLLQCEPDSFVKNLLDINYKKGDFEEFKKLFHRTSLGCTPTAEMCFSLGHIYSHEKDYNTAIQYIQKSFPLFLEGQTVHIKDLDAAIHISKAIEKSKLDRIKKNLLLKIVKNGIPVEFHQTIDDSISEKDEPRFLKLRKRVAASIFLDRINELEELKNNLENNYDKVWCNISLLSEKDGFVHLEKINKSYSDFFSTYEKLSGIEIIDKDFLKLYLMLKTKFDDIQFVTHTIMETVRQLYSKQNQQEFTRFEDITFSLKGSSKKSFRTFKIVKSDEESENIYKQKIILSPKKTLGIKSFLNAETKNIFDNSDSLNYPQSALDILAILNSASSIYDLQSKLTRGSNLEKLKGDRKDQFSIRLNDQWRLCFNWISGEGAYNVGIVDYH